MAYPFNVRALDQQFVFNQPNGQPISLPWVGLVPRFLLALIATIEGKKVPIGSAFLIGPKLGMTARHNLTQLENGGSLPRLEAVQLEDELRKVSRWWDVDSACICPISDLAILRMSTQDGWSPPKIRYPCLHFDPVGIGEKLYCVGFPNQRVLPDQSDGSISRYKKDLTISVDEVSNYYHVRRDSCMINFPAFETRGALSAGMSGGPAMCKQGYVRGVISSSFQINGKPCPPSHVAAIWPSIAMRTDLYGLGRDEGFVFLDELIEGNIEAQSWEKTTLKVESDLDQIHITAFHPADLVGIDTRTNAEEGDPQAQYELGVHYERWAAKPDMENAAGWYRKAADGGHADALNNLACLTVRGDGVALDEKLAVDLFREAAEKGSVDAKRWIGCCLLNGVGVDCDLEASEEAFLEAVISGSMDARFDLAYSYYEGIFECSDDSWIIELLDPLVRHDIPVAMILMSKALCEGRGCEADRVESERLAARALRIGGDQAATDIVMLLSEESMR